MLNWGVWSHWNIKKGTKLVFTTHFIKTWSCNQQSSLNNLLIFVSFNQFVYKMAKCLTRFPIIDNYKHFLLITGKKYPVVIFTKFEAQSWTTVTGIGRHLLFGWSPLEAEVADCHFRSHFLTLAHNKTHKSSVLHTKIWLAWLFIPAGKQPPTRTNTRHI